jgi:acyl-CoA synthetase (AMP-forming)/AMP-acid ligase II
MEDSMYRNFLLFLTVYDGYIYFGYSQGRVFSWEETYRIVSALQHFLLEEIGVTAGDRIAVLARNSDVYLQYMYAAARIECTLVALNAQWSFQVSGMIRAHVHHTSIPIGLTLYRRTERNKLYPSCLP